MLAVILTLFVGAISAASLTSDDVYLRYPQMTSLDKAWTVFKATHGQAQ